MKIIDIEAKEIGKRDLPSQFNEEVRPDLIKRAFLVLRSNKRQPYGANPEAGKRSSAKLSRRRHDYKGAYGHGISRVPRKIMSRSGTRFNWVGAFAPGTVGGREAHPPKASKILKQKINKKEKRKAIRSAISATINNELVQERGHVLPKSYPIIVDKKMESMKTTKEVLDFLTKCGLEKELSRAGKKTVRAGKGKSRGRKYKKRKGPLIVVSKQCEIMKAAKNIPGLDIEQINKINVELLAPGSVPGRLTIWSNEAIDKIEKDKLFI